MNYWWVNQKQTHRHEIGNGYMWSPKRQKDGKKHYSYEWMKHVCPGDIVFSYAHAKIVAIGVVQTHCYSYPKPLEFGKSGVYWSDEGWKIDVNYTRITEPLRTIDYIDQLRPYLTALSHSPMRLDNGFGNQAYLFLIDRAFAQALARLIDNTILALVNGSRVLDGSVPSQTINLHIEEWEDKIEEQVIKDKSIEPTEKDAIVKARRGQGKFRELLLTREPRCRITGVDRPEHLIASHIKPWRSASNGERLDPENGFMLTPTIDHLFDKGFISFENNGIILLADVADRAAIEKMGVIGANAPVNIGILTAGQKRYLDWHRQEILLS